MANKFQFKLLTNTAGGKTSAEKYADIKAGSGAAGIQDFTFYLLEDGTGYLGNTPLFGGDAELINIASSNIGGAGEPALKPNAIYFVTDAISITEGDAAATVKSAAKGSIWVADANAEKVTELSQQIFNAYLADYIANTAVKSANIVSVVDGKTVVDATQLEKDAALITAKAVKDYVDTSINNQTILDIAFFNEVSQTVVLADADITAKSVTMTFSKSGSKAVDISSLNDAHAGDIVFAFAIQTGSGAKAAVEYIPVNLHGLIDIYEAGATDTTTVTVTPHATKPHVKEIKVEVNKSEITATDIASAIEDAISSSYTGGSLSEDKFISEKQLATILANVLKNFVQYTED